MSNILLGGYGALPSSPLFKMSEPTVTTISEGFKTDIVDQRFPYAEWTGAQYKAETGPIYPTTFCLGDNQNSFHLRVWRASPQAGAACEHHGFVMIPDRLIARLAFTDPYEHAAFETWWRRYIRFYGPGCPVETTRLPFIRHEGRITATTVDRVGCVEDAAMIERWAWITEQDCDGRVWFERDAILFESDALATAYRLRWMGA